MTLLHALLLGLVEGITEFLPISSTGHLILTVKLLGLAQDDFIKSFQIIIQLGAIAAVLCLYGKKLATSPKVQRRVLAAFLPTAVIGLLLYPWIKKELLGNSAVVLWSLFLGGLLLIVFERFHREKETDSDEISDIPYHKMFLIGLFQAISVVPGVSRSAATIVGGLFLGLKRKTIVEFSFLLAIPTMLAATGLDMVKNFSVFSSDQFLLLSVGFITSFVVALFSIRFLLHFIQKNNFIPFGIYRVILAVLFWFFA